MGDARPEHLSRWFLGRLFVAVLVDSIFDVRAKRAVRDYHQRIKGNTPGVGIPGLIFCGCDDRRYNAFGTPFLMSAEALGRPLHIHLHLCWPTQETLDHVDGMRRSLSHVKLTFTWEDDTGAAASLGAPIGFAAARFLVLHHLLSACRAPILCLDIDGVIHRAPTDIFEAIRRSDVMLRFRPGGYRFGRNIMAGAVGVGPTREALGFTKKLAGALWKGLRMRPRGRIDQPVLSYLYEIRGRLRPRLRLQPFPARLIGAIGDGEAVWSATERIGPGRAADHGASAVSYSRAIEEFYGAEDRALGDGTHG
jgi:hypothetical protein